MMNKKLKPCPFCGGQAYIKEKNCTHYRDGTFGATYYVGCDTCGFSLCNISEFCLEAGQVVFKQNGYEKCVDQWNKRVGDSNA